MNHPRLTLVLGKGEALYENGCFMNERNGGDGKGGQTTPHKKHTCEAPPSTKTAAGGGGVSSTEATEEKDIATPTGPDTQLKDAVHPSPILETDSKSGSAEVGTQQVENKADIQLTALKTEAPCWGHEVDNGGKLSGSNGIDGDLINLVVVSGMEAFNLPGTSSITFGGKQVRTDGVTKKSHLVDSTV